MILWWSPFKFVSVSTVLYPIWPPLLKIEISSNGQNCSILSQKVPKFELYKHNDELFSGHLGYRTVLTDTILKGDHLRIISAKFGWDWLSSLREDFFLISSPLFSNLHNRNFEVNLITHLGVIALFSSFFFFHFNTFRLIFQKLFRDRC
jgi:hypothetical protein